MDKYRQSKDKKEVLLKWHSDFETCFKGMKDDPDLVFDDVFLDQVTKLKDDFDKLLPEEQMSNSPFDSSALNIDITYEEVSNAIDKAKNGKAFLNVPNEAMKNPQAKLLLQKMFNICFHSFEMFNICFHSFDFRKKKLVCLRLIG